MATLCANSLFLSHQPSATSRAYKLAIIYPRKNKGETREREATLALGRLAAGKETAATESRRLRKLRSRKAQQPQELVRFVVGFVDVARVVQRLVRHHHNGVSVERIHCDPGLQG